jgi:hypothetical protein
MQKDALVIAATSMYFIELKKEMSSMSALDKSLISKISKFSFSKEESVFKISKILLILIGPLF